MMNIPKGKVTDGTKWVDSTKLLDKLKADIFDSAQGHWKIEDFDTDDYYDKIVGIYGSNLEDYSPVIDSVVNTSRSTSIPLKEYYPLEEIELKKGDDVSLEEDEKGNIVYSEDGEIINLSSDDLFIKINGNWAKVHLNNIKCENHYSERSRVILEFII